MSSTFGRLFRITTFGESHGNAVGGVIDGCPARMRLAEDDIQPYLDRRRPGQNALSSARQETDLIRITSGVEQGLTLGTPISLTVANRDAVPEDYAAMQSIPRPSHADYTYQAKYGIRSVSGGGRASARETVARVAAGAVGDLLLRRRYGIDIVAWVSAVGEIAAPDPDRGSLTRADIDTSAVRCPHAETTASMEQAILDAAAQSDSLGGIISCVCRGVPAGLGEPVFDKLEARLAQAMLSIPAVKGFDIGSGFSGTSMKGSRHNDVFIKKGSGLGTVTNNSGGCQGGISNGEDIYFRVAFKPTATIGKAQTTADFDGNPNQLAAKGRHDPCVVPRAVPIVESMAALTIVDFILIQKMRSHD